MDVIKTVQNIIAADANIGSNLAQWDFGSGKEAAIFTIEPPPAECGYPILILKQTGGEAEHFDRTHRGGFVSVNLRLFGNKTGSNKGLNKTIDDIFNLLYAITDFDLDDFTYIMHSLTEPDFTMDDEGFPGYEINLTIKYHE